MQILVLSMVLFSESYGLGWKGSSSTFQSSPLPHSPELPTVLKMYVYTHRDSKMYRYSQQKEIDPAIFQLKGKSMKDLLMKEIR